MIKGANFALSLEWVLYMEVTALKHPQNSGEEQPVLQMRKLRHRLSSWALNTGWNEMLGWRLQEAPPKFLLCQIPSYIPGSQKWDLVSQWKRENGKSPEQGPFLTWYYFHSQTLDNFPIYQWRFCSYISTVGVQVSGMPRIQQSDLRFLHRLQIL